MDAVRGDKEVVAKRFDGSVVFEFAAAIVSFGGGREDFVGWVAISRLKSQ
jgi:hypothetical protein